MEVVVSLHGVTNLQLLMSDEVIKFAVMVDNLIAVINVKRSAVLSGELEHLVSADSHITSVLKH